MCELLRHSQEYRSVNSKIAVCRMAYRLFRIVGIGVSEYVRWTHEQPMVEASKTLIQQIKIFWVFCCKYTAKKSYSQKVAAFCGFVCVIVGRNGSFTARNLKNEIFAVNMQQIQIKKSNLLY